MASQQSAKESQLGASGLTPLQMTGIKKASPHCGLHCLPTLPLILTKHTHPHA